MQNLSIHNQPLLPPPSIPQQQQQQQQQQDFSMPQPPSRPETYAVEEYEENKDQLDRFMARELYAAYRDKTIWDMDVEIDPSTNNSHVDDDALSVASASTLTTNQCAEYSSTKLICEIITSAQQQRRLNQNDPIFPPTSAGANMIDIVDIGRPNASVSAPMLLFVAQQCFPFLDQLDQNACMQLQMEPSEEQDILVFLVVLLQHIWPENEQNVEPFGTLPCTRINMAEWVVSKFCKIVDLLNVLQASSVCWMRFFTGLQRYIVAHKDFNMIGGYTSAGFGRILGYQVALYTSTSPTSFAQGAMYTRLCLVNALLGSDCLGVRFGRSTYAIQHIRPPALSTPRMLQLDDQNIENIMAFVGIWMPVLTGRVVITGSCLFNVLVKPLNDHNITAEQRSEYYLREYPDSDVNVVLRRHYVALEGRGNVARASLEFVESVIREISVTYPEPHYKLYKAVGLTTVFLQVVRARTNQNVGRCLSISLLETDGEGADHGICSTAFTNEGWIIPLMSSPLPTSTNNSNGGASSIAFQNQNQNRRSFASSSASSLSCSSENPALNNKKSKLRPAFAQPSTTKKKSDASASTSHDDDDDDDDDNDDDDVHMNGGGGGSSQKYQMETVQSRMIRQDAYTVEQQARNIRLAEKMQKAQELFEKAEAKRRQKSLEENQRMREQQQARSRPILYAFITQHLLTQLSNNQYNFDRQDRVITNRVLQRMRQVENVQWLGISHNTYFPRIIPKPFVAEDKYDRKKRKITGLHAKLSALQVFSKEAIETEQESLQQKCARVRVRNIAEVTLCRLARDDPRPPIEPFLIQTDGLSHTE